MPLPCPGPASISFLDIQNEFGGSNPIGVNEYYRGKLWSFYRYYTNIFDNHFYTATATNEFLTQNGYVLEYPNYFLAHKDNISGTTALYRLFNDNLPTKNQHLLTTDFSEYAYLIGQGWNDEGIVGYVYSSSVADSQPVYRWRKNDSTNYFFTTSGAETPADYTYESIGFYALQFGAVAYVSDNNTSVPTSGTISLDNFFCAVNEIIVYITSNSENVNVQSLFGGYWTQNVPKRLVINPGVVVGSLDPSAYALTIPGGVVSTLRIDNNGSIQGAGGSPIPFSAGNGGPAIYAGSAVTIDNIGSIYGGGGAGGAGGQGGDGVYTYECFETAGGPFSGTVFADIGGNGGQGQGYAQNATGGEAGYPSITSCGDGDGCPTFDQNGNFLGYSFVCLQEGITGAGGAGGAGGSFGNNGGTGQTGASGNATGGQSGYSGGFSGCYITFNGNVTWVNTGDRRGQVC